MKNNNKKSRKNARKFEHIIYRFIGGTVSGSMLFVPDNLHQKLMSNKASFWFKDSYYCLSKRSIREINGRNVLYVDYVFNKLILKSKFKYNYGNRIDVLESSLIDELIFHKGVRFCFNLEEGLFNGCFLYLKTSSPFDTSVENNVKFLRISINIGIVFEQNNADYDANLLIIQQYHSNSYIVRDKKVNFYISKHFTTYDSGVSLT